MDNFTDLKITEHKSKINDEIVEDIFKILREENSKSIISKISKKVFIKYLNLLINSKNIYLFTLTVNEQIAGYAIIAEKPKYLIQDFKSLKFEIFLSLLLKGKLFSLLDIMMTILKLDTFGISRENKVILNESLNLNLIAIKKEFQSIGYGEKFLQNIIKKMKEKNNYKYIVCETYSQKAENFYLKKFDFVYFGKKFRTSGILKILKKKL